ncbi:tetratricopeptide repeat protein [Amycolatopsis japonica]|uniref:tetratricopeptide repeat protein n=1 Tax=Amycolatopsis japonica TaxID=208439 RepID=UPI00380046B0
MAEGGARRVVADPTGVTTRAELAANLDALRRQRGLSYDEIAKASRSPERTGLPAIGKSTVADLCTKGAPRADTLRSFLVACGVSMADQAQWMAAAHRAQAGENDPGEITVRVEDADPRHLGVHAAIAAGQHDRALPTYVLRDTDDVKRHPDGLRARVAAAAATGGFVLIVGGSSVGKTRSAYEAVLDLVGSWRLIHPGGPDELVALAKTKPSRVVVWLDEIQRYLTGDKGLTGATVRKLLAGDGPVLLIGTVWPNRYNTYVNSRAEDWDPFRRQREVVELADVVHLGEHFTPAELERARAIASEGDARVALALKSRQYGMTQVMAGAPQLVDRWEAADPYQRAVLSAAIDATWLGVEEPVTAVLLHAAAPGYCDSRERATAAETWFDDALAYATELRHGATSALLPQASDDGRLGRAAGYVVADYLLQYAGGRRKAKPPQSFWDACLTYLTDVDELKNLALSAHERSLLGYTERLLEKAADIGDRDATDRLVRLLIEQNRVMEAIIRLRPVADAGDHEATWWLIDLLVEEGDVDAALRRLGPLAASGDAKAVDVVTDLLAEQGDVGELRRRAAEGDQLAALRLAELELGNGLADEALARLRALGDAGNHEARQLLIDVLAENGRLKDLRTLADETGGLAAWALARVLIESGRVREAISRLRAEVTTEQDRHHLAVILVERGKVDEAIAVAAPDMDDRYAHWLAGRLAEQGRVDEAIDLLRPFANGLSYEAVERLAEFLAQQGKVDEAIDLVHPYTLIENPVLKSRHLDDLYRKLLARSGNIKALEELGNNGDVPALLQLALLHASRGSLAESIAILQPLAEGGYVWAAIHLTELLAENGREAELLTFARQGIVGASDRLADLLEARGQAHEAERLRTFGLNPDGTIASAPSEG